jgi:hypothetical protein
LTRSVFVTPRTPVRFWIARSAAGLEPPVDFAFEPDPPLVDARLDPLVGNLNVPFECVGHRVREIGVGPLVGRWEGHGDLFSERGDAALRRWVAAYFWHSCRPDR